METGRTPSTGRGSEGPGARPGGAGCGARNGALVRLQRCWRGLCNPGGSKRAAACHVARMVLQCWLHCWQNRSQKCVQRVSCRKWNRRVGGVLVAHQQAEERCTGCRRPWVGTPCSGGQTLHTVHVLACCPMFGRCTDPRRAVGRARLHHCGQAAQSPLPQSCMMPAVAVPDVRE
jgi:hypothetical protein